MNDTPNKATERLKPSYQAESDGRRMPVDQANMSHVYVRIAQNPSGLRPVELSAK